MQGHTELRQWVLVEQRLGEGWVCVWVGGGLSIVGPGHLLYPGLGI